MKKVFICFFIFSFFFTPHAFADEGWIINNFKSDITIQKTGVVQIVETIAVDFRNLDKHGIYRDIPFIYDEKSGEKYYTEISLQQVLQDGVPATYSPSTNGYFKQIKIGDADKTISGKHTYVLNYTVKGVLQRFSSFDELYWNVTGNNWPVAIENTLAKVILPEDGIVQLACYQGYEGNKIPCTARKLDEKTAEFAPTQLLLSLEGKTISVEYKKGMVPILTVERPKTFLEKFLTWPSELTLLSVIGFGFVTSFLLWLSKGRDFWRKQQHIDDKNTKEEVKPLGAKETTVVEFIPPDNLRPAEIGVLMDEKADTLDVTATIIDLTTRGYMTITEIQKKWLFGSTDYELKQTDKNNNNLLEYEKYLLSSIFSGGKTKKVSTMKNDFYDELAKIKEMIYKELLAKGLFVENPNSSRNFYGGIGVVLLIVGILASFMSIGNEYVFLSDITIGIAVSGVILMIFSRFMGRRTAKGRELYRRVKGYREFIGTAERYRQKFFEKENLFSQALPYAIVFGLTEKFANAMKEIGLKNPHVSGYYGAYPFNAYTFGSSVNAFSNSFSSAAASKPSSSGSGGGGSSGGGFGGGGGGSW